MCAKGEKRKRGKYEIKNKNVILFLKFSECNFSNVRQGIRCAKRISICLSRRNHLFSSSALHHRVAENWINQISHLLKLKKNSSTTFGNRFTAHISHHPDDDFSKSIYNFFGAMFTPSHPHFPMLHQKKNRLREFLTFFLVSKGKLAIFLLKPIEDILETLLGFLLGGVLLQQIEFLPHSKSIFFTPKPPYTYRKSQDWMPKNGKNSTPSDVPTSCGKFFECFMSAHRIERARSQWNARMKTI